MINYLKLFISYGIWIGIPALIYFVQHIDSSEIFYYRALSFLIFTFFYILLTNKMRTLKENIFDRTKLKRALFSSLFLAINWIAFIVAVSTHNSFQSSLGYLVSPIVGIILARIFLNEELSFIQTISTVLLVVTLIIYIITNNQIPYYSFFIIFSWSFYGFYQKKYPQNPSSKTFIEVFFMCSITILLYPILKKNGYPFSIHHSITDFIFLALVGILSGIALVNYNSSIQRISLKNVSIAQYSVPIGQLLVAVFLFKENISMNAIITYTIIFILSIIFTFSKKRLPKNLN